MDPVLPIVVFSVLLGAVIALVFFNSYFRKRRSEVRSIANPVTLSDPNKHSKQPQQPKKSHARPHAHAHAADKDHNKRHHPLDLNTLKGHGDAVTGICFSPDGRNLATGI